MKKGFLSLKGRRSGNLGSSSTESKNLEHTFVNNPVMNTLNGSNRKLNDVSADSSFISTKIQEVESNMEPIFITSLVSRDSLGSKPTKGRVSFAKGFLSALYVLSMSENILGVQLARNGANTSGKKKQAELPSQKEWGNSYLVGKGSLHMVSGFMASTGLKRGSGSSYGTNSLLGQWMETKRDDDYDPYDDDLYESHDMSINLQAICHDFDIK
nr:hypothetical protein [Tanacetum cinerariifolium]